MSLWSRFPLVRITLALAGGILAARYWGMPGGWVAVGLGFLLLLYFLIALIIVPASFRAWSPWLGVLGLSCIFLLGYLRYWAIQVGDAPAHLAQWATAVEAYEAIALEDLHQRSTSNRVVVAVRRARVHGAWQPMQGKVQVSFPEDTALQVHYGDILLIKGQPQEVLPPQNPHAFNYAAFLGLSQVYHQHWTVEKEVAVLDHRPANLFQAWSCQIMCYCQTWFKQAIQAPAASAVVLALVLGQKDALTSEVRSAYAGAGTMHVLAVSGLHVGILYWIVGLLVGLLNVGRHIGRAAPLVSLVVIWLYAFVTGLSPSVLRATLMFTLVALAASLRRQGNIYNTLAGSAFLLLYWNPNWLFAVGFQLSYVAVLGIVYLQPRIYGWWTSRYWILDKLWLLSSVSLAAQLATAPISLYYFHQFPTYFLLANWVVVPAAMVILCLGLMVLATSFWPSLSMWIAWVLERIVLGVNAFVAGIQKIPYSLLDDIYLSALTVLLLYGLLVLWLVLWRTRQFRYGVATSLVALLLSAQAVHRCLIQQAQRKVVFYSINRHQAVAFIQGRHSTLWTDDNLDPTTQEYAYQIQPSQVAWGITASAHYTLQEAGQWLHFPLHTWQGLRIACWQGKQFIFVDKGSLPLPHWDSKVHTDFLVVEENAVSSLQPLLDRFVFGTLVVGASNTKSTAKQLQEAAAQHGLTSHSLHRQGALVVAW